MKGPAFSFHVSSNIRETAEVDYRRTVLLHGDRVAVVLEHEEGMETIDEHMEIVHKEILRRVRK